MKLVQCIVFTIIVTMPFLAKAIPVTYILDGWASGSYNEESFTGKRLGILIEADTETIAFGSEPYVAGSHPDSQWYTQSEITRIQTLFPAQSSDPILPYPMGLMNPGDFQLMSWNIGSYDPIYSNSPPSSPMHFVALCSNGLSRYDCVDNYSAAFMFQVPNFVDLAGASDQSVNYLSFNFEFETTSGGGVKINGLQDANFEVRPAPVPEPSTMLLVGIGATLLAAYRKRQQK